jgi:hypothetical protein
MKMTPPPMVRAVCTSAPPVWALPGRLSALRVSHSQSILYGAFLWARRTLNSPYQRFLAWAVETAAAAPPPLTEALKVRSAEESAARDAAAREKLLPRISAGLGPTPACHAYFIGDSPHKANRGGMKISSCGISHGAPRPDPQGVCVQR